MTSSGKINALGEQYIGASGSSGSSSGGGSDPVSVSPASRQMHVPLWTSGLLALLFLMVIQRI
jgi:hypothetical protein